MPVPSPLAPFLDPLERLGFPHCIPAAFPENAYYVPPEESLRLEWALEHRRRIALEGSGAWIAPPEYVILRKLEYLREGGSDKHTRDIRFMLAATAVDLAFVEAGGTRLGLQEQWRRCQNGAERVK